jgi:hypothetical protein
MQPNNNISNNPSPARIALDKMFLGRWKALDDEYDVKRANLEEEYERKRAALNREYDSEREKVT